MRLSFEQQTNCEILIGDAEISADFSFACSVVNVSCACTLQLISLFSLPRFSIVESNFDFRLSSQSIFHFHLAFA
jgi:hypothetical protein